MKNHINNLFNHGWTKIENVYDNELMENIKKDYDKKKKYFL